MTHYTRAQWGARAPRAGNGVYNGPKGIAYHYNGPKMGIDPNAPCNCAARVRSIQNFHMDGRGWADIAYDVIACPHGNTYQGRLGTRNGTGANGTTYANQNYMAVMALIGEGDPLGANLKRALLSGRELCRKAGAGSAVTGHQAHQSTACPGGPIMEWIKAGVPAPTDPTRPRRGDRGDLVKSIQERLIAHGYDLGPSGADGVFGALTDTAVRDFQARNGLDVDGVVGPKTMAALNKPVAPAKPKPTPPKEIEDMNTDELRNLIRDVVRKELDDERTARSILTRNNIMLNPLDPDGPRVSPSNVIEHAAGIRHDDNGKPVAPKE